MAHDAGTQAAGAAESQPPVDQASTGSAEPASARDLPPIEVPEASLRTIRVVDAGMVSLDHHGSASSSANGGSRVSYAETIYEQPPPAYDAIDWSLPQVPLPTNARMRQ